MFFVNRFQKLEDLMTLFDFDRDLKKMHNVAYLAGVDEAGRGPLAGPVVASAVILSGRVIEGLNDSKRLSASKRAVLYEIIIQEAIAYSVCLIHNDEIDKYNILNATKVAMINTISQLHCRPELIAVDAVSLPTTDIPQISIIKGDAKSACIAAASIIAKQTRDNIMKQYHEMYPQYRFDLHKGYPTRLHLQMLRKYGPCPIHRKTFKHVLDTHTTQLFSSFAFATQSQQ